MFNVCPIQETVAQSCNVIDDDGTPDNEILAVSVDIGWYLVDLSGTVFLDDSTITTGTGFSLFVDNKELYSLPSGTFNQTLILRASKNFLIKVTRDIADELTQATFFMAVTKIKPLCEA